MRQFWDGITRIFESVETLEKEFKVSHYLTETPITIGLERDISNQNGSEATALLNDGTAAIINAIEIGVYPGDFILFSKSLYPGTITYAEEIKNWGFEVIFFDPTNMEELERMINEFKPKVVFAEVIGNSLTMPVLDYDAIIKILAGTGITLILDNTLVPTFYPHEINEGNESKMSTILVGSLSKWETSGMVAGGRISGSLNTIQRIKESSLYRASLMQPEIAKYISLWRGPQAFSQFCANAFNIAVKLQDSPRVKNVYYPGLPEHPGYKTNLYQMDGMAGGVLYAEMEDQQSIEEMIGLLKRYDDFNSWSIAASFGTEDYRILPLGLLDSDYQPGSIRIAAGLHPKGWEVLSGVLIQMNRA